MKYKLYSAIAMACVGLLCPICVVAQSQEGVSLGELARSLRKNKAQGEPVVIDNDNMPQVMDDVEKRRLAGGPLFRMDGSGKNFQMSSPDGICSLSFSANATSLLTVPYVAEDLPQNELAKLDGPAIIDGDTLQVSVYNGSEWNIKEITVGLTIVRRADARAAYYGNAKLLPAAAADDPLPAGKPSDLTLLLHLKGMAAPLGTTVFREKLGATLAPDQEWHWSIVQAKGVPPTAAPLLPAISSK